MTEPSQRAKKIVKKLEDAIGYYFTSRGVGILRDALDAERVAALNEAANLVDTLAERPYDNEPEFSAMISAATRIRNLKLRPRNA